MDTVRAAGLLVFRRCSYNRFEFLLLKASYGINHWSVTKGHVDPGEDELTTAYRETEEEAGLSKHQLRLTAKEWTLRYNVKSHIDHKIRPKTTRLWLAEHIAGDVRLSEEHTDFHWGDVESTNNLLADYKDMQQMISAANDFIINENVI